MVIRPIPSKKSKEFNGQRRISEVRREMGKIAIIKWVFWTAKIDITKEVLCTKKRTLKNGVLWRGKNVLAKGPLWTEMIVLTIWEGGKIGITRGSPQTRVTKGAQRIGMNALTSNTNSDHSPRRERRSTSHDLSLDYCRFVKGWLMRERERERLKFFFLCDSYEIMFHTNLRRE